jgi:hypothetical protein
VLRVDAGGVVRLRGTIDKQVTGALGVMIVFDGGRNGRAVLVVPILQGRFATSAQPVRRPQATCDARYTVTYSGSAAYAPDVLRGRTVVACRQSVEDAS